ncbi:NAD(P)/FAD-dependent oxidoreductase [Aeromicrobium wangtongii]|uniref:FAD-dependent oxidoreductase n=1 Tax=Aeromicrobium wangtongii TaxID=2969247 RepID=A0ABY5MES2_9ACTN|nr:FAD-dependent oxidoreductase [Aeromicrobium wangtongii]MCD9196827.1 FAD-dependent oxidoreductase [Aeromicrobium wangtongii]UUP14336.1 FAD-dependent oxidoreductase [Aeromicrobium wangtongii]
MTDRTVILGAGIAGVSAAAAMRAAGHTGQIHLVGDEPGLPYRRPPVSKEIIRGEKTADDIRIKKAEWFGQKDITLHTGTPADAIDTDRRIVRLADGEELGFDQLLIATGGRARNPWHAPGIRTLRGLADVAPLQAGLVPGASVVIVGAGLIGSEIAASATDMGCRVTLLEAADLPLPRLLPPELGEMYADLHRSRGTELHTGVTVESIDDAGDTTSVRAVDGRTWTAQVVVVAVGMQPNTEIAAAAGIELARPEDGGGILVDAHGRTSVDGIFAAGDVANQPNPVLGGRHRVEHWQGAQNHGTAVGKVMAGGSEPFAEAPWCWSDQYDLNLQVAGWPQGSHELVVDGSIAQHDFIAYLLDDGIVHGAVSIGRPRDVRTARGWILDGARLADVLPREG